MRILDTEAERGEYDLLGLNKAQEKTRELLPLSAIDLESEVRPISTSTHGRAHRTFTTDKNKMTILRRPLA